MYEHEHAMQRPVFLAKQAWPDRVKEAACLIVGFSFSFFLRKIICIVKISC